MVAHIDIANNALIIIGEQTIISLDQECRQARTIKAIYNILLDQELANHPWNFARQRAILARVLNSKDHDLFYYQLPHNWLQTLAIFSSYGKEISVNIKQEGNFIISPYEETIELNYIARIDDPDIFSAQFRYLFACRIALEIAETLTQSPVKQNLALKKYQAALINAKRANNLNCTPEKIPESTWILNHLS